MKKRIPAVILMFSLFLTGAFAANTYQKSINVEYGITLSINGQTPRLTDVNGKTVQPFVYDGTTYVPIRAVGENLGASVIYEQSTNTAYVTDTKDIEGYLYYLGNATNVASSMCGYVSQYQAMQLGNVRNESRFYPTVSNLVKSTQKIISFIPNNSTYYDEAEKINTMLDEMLTAFADMEDAYYNKQINKLTQAMQIIIDNYFDINDMMIKAGTLIV